jgi:AMP-binding enzyme
MSLTILEPGLAYRAADTSAPLLETTVGGVLRAAADADADAIAMVAGMSDPADRRSWTYGQLLDEAERAARALYGRFEPEERVAVWAPGVPEWVVLELAAGLAGLTLVTRRTGPTNSPTCFASRRPRESSWFPTSAARCARSSTRSVTRCRSCAK